MSIEICQNYFVTSVCVCRLIMPRRSQEAYGNRVVIPSVSNCVAIYFSARAASYAHNHLCKEVELVAELAPPLVGGKWTTKTNSSTAREPG